MLVQWIDWYLLYRLKTQIFYYILRKLGSILFCFIHYGSQHSKHFSANFLSIESNTTNLIVRVRGMVWTQPWFFADSAYASCLCFFQFHGHATTREYIRLVGMRHEWQQDRRRRTSGRRELLLLCLGLWNEVGVVGGPHSIYASFSFSNLVQNFFCSYQSHFLDLGVCKVN